MAQRNLILRLCSELLSSVDSVLWPQSRTTASPFGPSIRRQKRVRSRNLSGIFPLRPLAAVPHLPLRMKYGQQIYAPP